MSDPVAPSPPPLPPPLPPPPPEEYFIRWRGRQEGPFTLARIETMLQQNRVGMLHEICRDGEWITLKGFLGEREAVREEGECRDGPVRSFQRPPAAETNLSLDHVMADCSKAPSRSSRGIGSVLLLALLVAAIGVATWAGLTWRKKTLGARHGREPSPAGTHAMAGTNGVALPPSRPSIPATNGVAESGSNSLAVAPPVPPATPLPPAGPTNSNPVSVPSKTVPPAPRPPVEPLPENENRTFRLKDQTEYTGLISHVNAKGIIISRQTGGLTGRIPWNQFDPAALEGEPKVMAYHKAEEQKKVAAEKVAAAAKEARDRAAEAAAQKQAELAEWRSKQDALIETSIKVHGWEAVHTGYLKAWGTAVTIGRIFEVVAPSARWSAAKLAVGELERYTHYLVEANWTNDNGEPVAMQFLVDADGSDFRLHGCFVSKRKLPDGPFLLAVKGIWDKKNR